MYCIYCIKHTCPSEFLPNKINHAKLKMENDLGHIVYKWENILLRGAMVKMLAGGDLKNFTSNKRPLFVTFTPPQYGMLHLVSSRYQTLSFCIHITSVYTSIFLWGLKVVAYISSSSKTC